MLRVTIEVLPAFDAGDRRTLKTINISNVKQRRNGRCDYVVEADVHPPPVIERWDPERPVIKLVARAIGLLGYTGAARSNFKGKRSEAMPGGGTLTTYELTDEARAGLNVGGGLPLASQD